MQFCPGCARIAHKIGIIGAHQTNTAGSQIGQQARFVPGHAIFAKPLGVACAHIENDANVGPQHGRQFFHVALVADASLHDPKIFIAIGGKHGARHTDLVVVVQGVLGGFAAHAQHLSQHFLKGGFASRAGNAHNLGAGFIAPQGCDTAQRLNGIFHQQHRHARLGQRLGGQHGRSAKRHSRRHKIVSVYPAAGYADKKRTGRCLAAVCYGNSQHKVALKGAQAQMGRYFIVGQAQCKNSLTTSWSL